MNIILRYFCIASGFLSLGIGLFGAIVPIIPTTPFILLSALLFAKSSKRFHTWLIETKVYKKYIEQAVNKKEMTKKAKCHVLSSIGILFIIGIIFTPIWQAKILILIVAIGHFYYFLFKIRTVKEKG